MNKIITIDGPAASGKSILGYRFARELNFSYFDAGSIFRAGCVALLKLGCTLDDDEFNRKVFARVLLELSFSNTLDGQRIFVGVHDITKEIQSQKVTKIVPTVGSKSLVRNSVWTFLKRQTVDNCVMAGRDMGNEVFPNADLKLFLTADPEVRAKRRYTQLTSRSSDLPISYEDILSEITARDHKDSNRAISPFKIPEGARIIDTSNLSKSEVVDSMLHIYKESFPFNDRERKIL